MFFLFNVHYCSAVRSFSNVAREETRYFIARTEDGAGGENYPFQKDNWKRPKVSAVQKQMAISTEELSTSAPKKKAATPKRNTASSEELTTTTLKKRPATRKRNAASSEKLATITPEKKAAAPKEVKSLKNSEAKNSRSKTSKKSLASIEV